MHIVDFIDTLIGHPFGFFRSGENILSEYKSQFSKLIASSKVKRIICGTWFASNLEGIMVPSLEQKQSGKTHLAGSHEDALFGS